ncbi:hypothetical protein PAXRUDRAFT_160118, partial [Paxillus rubicundulus Ve08.2h10]
HADVMVLANKEESLMISPHPYWYARIIGIFHINVQHAGHIKSFDILWVRWFGRNVETPTVWAAKRLPCIGFYDSADPSAFGFLDPDSIIRGVHLIPAFTYGRTSELSPASIARQPADNNEDWS